MLDKDIIICESLALSFLKTKYTSCCPALAETIAILNLLTTLRGGVAGAALPAGAAGGGPNLTSCGSILSLFPINVPVGESNHTSTIPPDAPTLV
jgi:hypothetical protein